MIYILYLYNLSLKHFVLEGFILNSFKEILLIIYKIMAKSVDNLTLEEIKEQMALYARLYYKKRRETDPEFIERKRERDRQLFHEKKKAKEQSGESKSFNYNRKYSTENMMLITPDVN